MFQRLLAPIIACVVGVNGGRGARTQEKKLGTAGWPSSLASSPHFSPSSPLRSLAIWSLKGHVKCLENDWRIKSDSVRP